MSGSRRLGARGRGRAGPSARRASRRCSCRGNQPSGRSRCDGTENPSCPWSTTAAAHTVTASARRRRPVRAHRYPQQSRSSSALARGKLDRQRHPVQPRHHRRGLPGQPEARVSPAGPVREQRHRLRPVRIRRITGVRQGQRRQPVPRLPGYPRGSRLVASTRTSSASSSNRPHWVTYRRAPLAVPAMSSSLSRCWCGGSRGRPRRGCLWLSRTSGRCRP